MLKTLISYSIILMGLFCISCTSWANNLPSSLIEQFLTAKNPQAVFQTVQQFKPYVDKSTYQSATFAAGFLNLPGKPIQNKIIKQQVYIILTTPSLRQQLLKPLLHYYQQKTTSQWVADAITHLLGSVPLENTVWHFDAKTKTLLLPFIKHHIPPCTTTTNMPEQLHYYNFIRTVIFLSSHSYKDINKNMAFFILNEKNPFCQNILIIYSAKLCPYLSKPQIKSIQKHLATSMEKVHTKRQKAILSVAKTQLDWDCLE